MATISPIGPIGPIVFSPITPHGGYQNLKSYQSSLIAYDFTVAFCNKYISLRSRTHDQMVQAGRSCKQNIVEGSQASGTSKKTELKLVSVARASHEELLEDCRDFLRQRGLAVWDKDSAQAKTVRNLAYVTNRSYKTYETYLANPETAANTLIILIHQTNYLLDRQLQTLQKKFVEEGGFTERLYAARQSYRSNSANRTNNRSISG